ncbi:hypothetical protein AWJ20_2798 [Sugiyamaella lignohabitans]|uniref:Karyogamy protein KAR9 n=1 Tax=Sugiyamaella lignohabitans TaxID=796027 RepID=A0A167FDV4_9ASCO|nr:uncharacterized protein AWJ20_2798 [Sugiyamaella lignohabitans]ANB15174.1 hypothetical protein AWJ20_2798 [Sugiyamaella lignohabitans]
MTEVNNTDLITAAAISRAPFGDQLSRLASITLPSPEEIDSLAKGNANTSGKPLSDKTVNASSPTIDGFPNNSCPTGPHAILAQISSAVDNVLFYFKTARAVLTGLDAEDNVEWIYEGRQAVFDVGSTILRAGDTMTQMMSVLEQTKSSNNDSEQQEQDDKLSAKQYIPVVDKIEQAIKEWHEILDLVRYLRLQVDISTEWKDLYEQILTEVSDEIDSCATSVFEIQEKLLSKAEPTSVDIDALITVMDESPYMGKIKLPSLTESERDLNRSYLELNSKLKPLRASLDFVPLRIEHYNQTAKDIFPSSVATLNKKHKELEERFDKVTRDVKALEKQLGDERWKTIFRKTGNKAVEMLNTLQENLNIISSEQQKARQGDKIDRAKMDRYATKNGYLMPAIARHISIIDRAIRERFSVTSEMYTVQAALHRQWNSLVLLAETKAGLDEELGEGVGSPCSGRGNNSTHSGDFSITTAFSQYSIGSSSPNSSPATSPTPSNSGTSKPGLVRHHRKKSSLDIAPVRGLAIKFPAPHRRKPSVTNPMLAPVGTAAESSTSSNDELESRLSSISSTTSANESNKIASPSPSSPSPHVPISSTEAISPSIMHPRTSPSTTAVAIVNVSKKSSPLPQNDLKSATAVSPSLSRDGNFLKPVSSLSHSHTAQNSIPAGRNSRLSMTPSSLSLLPLPMPAKQSQIPIYSPERKSFPSRASLGTPLSRPSSKLESRQSLTGAYPEFQTPSKLPRPASRRSDIGPTASMTERRTSSRIGMIPVPSTPAQGTQRASRVSMTPIPSTPNTRPQPASGIKRPTSRLEIQALHTPKLNSSHFEPPASTPSPGVSRRVSSSSLQRPMTVDRRLDRKVSLPSHLHQTASVRRAVTPFEMNRPGSSSSNSRIVPPVPSRPPWR